MIIFNEKKYAEDLLNNVNKLYYVKQRDLNILTKYYCYLGFNKIETREKIVEYAKKIDSNFNEIISDNSLDFALKNFGKAQLRVGNPVIIYFDEINKIRQIKSIKEQRIIFVMLVVSKSFNKSKTGDYYYNGLLSDAFRLAKMTGIPKNERIEIIHSLAKNGIIEPNLNGGYKIVIANKTEQEHEENIIISDFDNIMDKFPAICPICKKTMYGIPKRRNCCDECYEIKRREDIRKNVRKFRNRP